MKAQAVQMALIAVAYLVTYLLTFYLWMPVQNLFLEPGPVLASLIFLPHGVRVLSVFLVGARSIPPLLIVGIIVPFLMGYPASYLAGFAGALCAYLAFKIFLLAGYRVEPRAQLISQWRSLMLIAFVAAVINGLAIPTILLAESFTEAEVTPLILIFVVGDTLGAFMFFALLAAGGRTYQWLHGRLSG